MIDNQADSKQKETAHQVTSMVKQSESLFIPRNAGNQTLGEIKIIGTTCFAQQSITVLCPTTGRSEAAAA